MQHPLNVPGQDKKEFVGLFIAGMLHKDQQPHFHICVTCVKPLKPIATRHKTARSQASGNSDQRPPKALAKLLRDGLHLLGDNVLAVHVHALHAPACFPVSRGMQKWLDISLRLRKSNNKA